MYFCPSSTGLLDLLLHLLNVRNPKEVFWPPGIGKCQKYTFVLLVFELSPLKIARKPPFLHLPADFWKRYAEKNPNMLYINRKKILRGFQKSKLEVSEMKSEKMTSFLLFFEGVLTNFLPYARCSFRKNVWRWYWGLKNLLTSAVLSYGSAMTSHWHHLTSKCRMSDFFVST